MNNFSEKITATNVEIIQMFEYLAKNMYSGFEELVWLNISASKASVMEACRRAKTLLDAKDAQEWLRMQAEVLRFPTDDYAAHVQQLFDVIYGVHSEFAKSMDTIVAAFNKAINAEQIDVETVKNSAGKVVEVLDAD